MRKVDDIQICDACLIVADGDPRSCNGFWQRECKKAAKGIKANWPGMVIHSTSDEGGFSWSSCDGCGNSEGGQRYAAVVLADD